MANPFRAPVVRKVLETLDKQAASSGDRLDIVCQITEYADVYAEFPAFKLLWSETMPLSYD